MKVVATIEARMSASRLPGKMMLPLAGATMLERLVERLGRAKSLDGVTVASTVAPPDAVIADLCERRGIAVHRGPVEDIATRAASYSMPGVIVDGQDVDAVAAAMEIAVARARRGEGPSLLEMKTYRYSGHSRSDPATYRRPGELDEWLKRDPIDLLAKKLIAEKLLAEDGLDPLKADVRDAVEQATQEVLAAPHPDQREIMAHVSAASAGGDRRFAFWQ